MQTSALLGLLGVGIVTWLLLASGRDETPVRVAFIGNSFQFANDLPRFLESLAGPRIAYQDSMLHGSLSFPTLLRRGNGVYNRWRTSNAWNDTISHYDYGACTIPQLLVGYDEQLEDFDNFILDGKNPCFEDENYLQYTYDTKSTTPKHWDFVVLNDQSMRPAQSGQIKSLQALINYYVPLFEECGATPIFIGTYGYWRQDINMTDPYVDVPTFTHRLEEGYMDYVDTLSELLPESQQPRLAPVGIAFLVLWEENPKLWARLFGEDYFHPTPLGTFLMGNVIYATMFRQLPPADSVEYPSELFARARSMQVSGRPADLPTRGEATYLRWITQRVVMEGHRPQVLEKF